ncbi:MAG: demethoxyubiquinone hydroxylase family protein, partial [Candidatus Puniceispirillales bacterium]
MKRKYNDQDDVSRYLRVDHAGELGARRIYEGQLAVLGNHPVAAEIRHMRDQEQEHLDTFEDLLNEYQVRPTLLSPLWNGAGFMLGAVTAAMGPKAAMACTIAVEEVIGTHYDKQAKSLKD